jgi:hypothetical protein
MTQRQYGAVLGMSYQRAHQAAAWHRIAHLDSRSRLAHN